MIFVDLDFGCDAARGKRKATCLINIVVSVRVFFLNILLLQLLPTGVNFYQCKFYCSYWLKMLIPSAFPNSKYHLKFTEGEGESMEGKSNQSNKSCRFV